MYEKIDLDLDDLVGKFIKKKRKKKASAWGEYKRSPNIEAAYSKLVGGIAMAAALLGKCGGWQSFFLAESPGVIRRSIRTGVWWDINECKVPKGCDPFSITGNIAEALGKLNYAAPLTFSAYGNTYLIPLNVQHALLDSGVKLIHIPHGQSTLLFPSLPLSYFPLLIQELCDLFIILGQN